MPEPKAPAILSLQVRGRRLNEESFSLFCVKLGVTAVTACFAVFVGCHEDTGSALGADRLVPYNLVSLDFVCIGFLDCFLGCWCFCHSNHSWGASASALGASIPFLLRRYAFSLLSAASLLS